MSFSNEYFSAPEMPLLSRRSICPIGVARLEACGSAHHWGRAIGDLGHEVRLIPPIYVKPFVKPRFLRRGRQDWLEFPVLEPNSGRRPCDAEVEWTEAERFPYYGGTWHGPQPVVENLLAPLSNDWDDFSAKLTSS
jgi:hypothetical protein